MTIMRRQQQIPIEDVVRLRNAGFTVTEIAADLECAMSTVRAILQSQGMTGRYDTVKVERQQLLDLWGSPKTLSEIGIELGCSQTTVLRLRDIHGLPTRPAFLTDPDDAVSPEDDAASAESLALSPWVQARIRELKLGMPV